MTVADKDTAGVTIDPTELTVLEGQSNTYTVVLDTQPATDVTIEITGGGDVTTNPTQLVFTPTTWSTEQTVTVNAGEDDDAAQDSVTIGHSVADGSAQEYAGLTVGGVDVTVADKDSAGVSISETALTITEGGSDSYTVVLTTRPSADVTVAISGHAGTDVSLSGETLANDALTFTLDNWNQAQTVTVNAGEDDDAAQDSVTIGHSVAAVSAQEYVGLTIGGVDVTITDKDSAGMSISKDALSLTEGQSDTYTVVLDTPPAADVMVAISGHSGTDVSLSGETLTNDALTFTLDNWDQPQIVTVNAGEDDDAADEARVTLSHAVSGASEYQNVRAADVTVTVTDNDTAGVTISETALTITEGQSGTYTVVLDTQPSADVTVTISGHAGTDVSLSGGYSDQRRADLYPRQLESSPDGHRQRRGRRRRGGRGPGDPEPRRQRGQRVPERQRRRRHRGRHRQGHRRGDHLQGGAHDHRGRERQLHGEAGTLGPQPT